MRKALLTSTLMNLYKDESISKIEIYDCKDGLDIVFIKYNEETNQSNEQNFIFHCDEVEAEDLKHYVDDLKDMMNSISRQFMFRGIPLG